MTILIAGGTGLIGQRLTQLLNEKGINVHILTRQKIESTQFVKYFHWNVNQSIDMNAFENIDGIINLCGAGIADKRWSKKRKLILENSRTQPAKFLYQIMKSEGIHVDFYCSASGVNYYPNSSERIFNEDANAGPEFINQLCENWEKEAMILEKVVKQLIILRIGVVLAQSNSFLQKFTASVSFKIAAVFGSGEQPISWIHIDDLCTMFIHLILNKNEGVYNACSSDINSQISFIKKYLSYHNTKALIIKVPKHLSKLIFGEMSTLLNYGVKPTNQKVISTGFNFEFNDLKSAFKNIDSKKSKSKF